MLLLVFGISTLIVFSLIENFKTKIEGTTFIIVVIVRNVFYVVRIAVLIKNEKTIQVRIILLNCFNRKILKKSFSLMILKENINNCLSKIYYLYYININCIK